jgi:hypothetical protein
MTTDLKDLTTSQLHRIIAIKERIETLQSQIDSIAADGAGIPSPLTVEAPKKRRRRRSAVVRARMAAAQKARWAKVKGKAKSKPAKKGKRRLSAAHKAKLAAAAKARWAKAKREGKRTLVGQAAPRPEAAGGCSGRVVGVMARPASGGG